MQRTKLNLGLTIIRRSLSSRRRHLPSSSFLCTEKESHLLICITRSSLLARILVIPPPSQTTVNSARIVIVDVGRSDSWMFHFRHLLLIQSSNWCVHQICLSRVRLHALWPHSHALLSHLLTIPRRKTTRRWEHDSLGCALSLKTRGFNCKLL